MNLKVLVVVVQQHVTKKWNRSNTLPSYHVTNNKHTVNLFLMLKMDALFTGDCWVCQSEWFSYMMSRTDRFYTVTHLTSQQSGKNTIKAGCQCILDYAAQPAAPTTSACQLATNWGRSSDGGGFWLATFVATNPAAPYEWRERIQTNVQSLLN